MSEWVKIIMNDNCETNMRPFSHILKHMNKFKVYTPGLKCVGTRNSLKEAIELTKLKGNCGKRILTVLHDVDGSIIEIFSVYPVEEL